ncbi:MAG: hypothetical protein K2J83_03165 [Clostridia bacterium]|nr:hypothetical protein [Clostridia bacterium]
MKKIFKTLAILGVAGVAAAGVAAFSACSTDKSYDGDYHYASPYGFDYGIKVKVTVDANNKITKVTVVDSDYTEVSSVNDDYGWTQASVDNWNNNLNGLLEQYVGKTVEEILAIDVSVVSEDEANDYTPAGQPNNGQSLGGLVITDATQGCARLLLAVQDAVKDLAK